MEPFTSKILKSCVHSFKLAFTKRSWRRYSTKAQSWWSSRTRPNFCSLPAAKHILPSDTFNLIGKGNVAEDKYNLSEQSQKHGWSPKLSLRLFNMNFNNTYKICIALMKEHNPGRRCLQMSEEIRESEHTFLQRRDSIRKKRPEHPSPLQSMKNAHDTGHGREKRTDAKGVVCVGRTEFKVYSSLSALRNRQKASMCLTPQEEVIADTNYV